MNRRSPTPREIIHRLVTVQDGAASQTDSGERSLDVIASDESVDRYGDVISAGGWQLEAFRKNPIALFSHDQTAPIGTVSDVRVAGNQLLARIQFAAAGISARIDELWALVQAGVLRAVSVGFTVASMDDLEPIRNADQDVTGYRYLNPELLEISLVAVPANPNALALAKSLVRDPRAYFQPEEPTMEPTEIPAGQLRSLVQHPTRLSDALPPDIAAQIERTGRCSFEVATSLRVLARNTLGETVPVDPSVVGPTTLRLVQGYIAPSPLLIELLARVPAGGASITQNLIAYKPDTATGNKAAQVAEGAVKPESDLMATPSVLAFHVWAHHVGITKVALADLPALRQLLDTILTRGLLAKVDAGVYATLAAAATVFTPAAGSSVIDNAALACAQLTAQGGTGVVAAVNPMDLAHSDIAKASTSGVYVGRPPINGQVVGCPTIPTGKLLAFSNEGAYVAEREAVNVVAGLANDDFTRNIVRLLAEWRGVPVLQIPAFILSGDAAAAVGGATRRAA